MNLKRLCKAKSYFEKYTADFQQGDHMVAQLFFIQSDERAARKESCMNFATDHELH